MFCPTMFAGFELAPGNALRVPPSAGGAQGPGPVHYPGPPMWHVADRPGTFFLTNRRTRVEPGPCDSRCLNEARV